MNLEMGESLAYSWLRHERRCQIVQTNWKASKRWIKADEGCVDVINQKLAALFGKNIFKKSTSNQILMQTECDALGIALHEDGRAMFHAVEIAYHKNNLGYGNSETNIIKVLGKLARVALCLHVFFNTREGEIVFATPKIADNLENRLFSQIEELQVAINSELNGSFAMKFWTGEDFKRELLDKVLAMKKEVADTSELFMRANQLISMFNETKHSGKTEETAG